MFDGLKTAALSLGKTVVMGAVKHAPVICFVGGAVAFGATIYMAAKAAPEIKKDIENYNKESENLDKLYEEQEDEEQKLSKKEYNHEKTTLFVDTAVRVVKHGGGVVACAALSLSLFGLAAYIPCVRFAKLSGQYMVLDKSFKEYRAGVIAEEGEEKDRHYMFKTKEVVRTVNEGEENGDGKLEEVIEEGTENPLYWVWSTETSRIFSSSEVMNDVLLQAKEEALTRKLKLCHVITDNDILNELGMFDEIKKEPLTGIKFGQRWKNEGDNLFRFDIKKVWLPNYKKSSGHVLKYMISYDKELL